MINRLVLVPIASVFCALPALAQDQPSPGEVYVENMTYGGSGCPAGTVADNLSPDAKAITFLFSDFNVDTPSNGGRDVKKNCQVNLQLHVPQGWTYTLFSVDYRGFVDLDRVSKARLRSWYKIGSEEVRIANTTIDGPVSKDYHQRANVPLDALPWLTCSNSSTVISINTEIKGEGRKALVTVDSLDGEVTHQYGIAWKRCSNSTRWAGSCQVVLESQWGSNIKIFNSTSTGSSFAQAKGTAEQTARAQCEAERMRQRPLMQALTKCTTNAQICVATPQ